MNQYMELTNLNKDATMRDIETLCDVAKENHYVAVCVTPYYVTLASSLLKNTTVEVATVIDYPYGFETTAVKSYAAIEAIQNGATEVGMVLNVAMVKNDNYEDLQEEIEEIRDSIDGRTLKIMVDVSKLTEDELIKVVRICNETFVNYIEVINDYNEELSAITTILEHKGEVLEVKVNGTNTKDMLTIVEKGISRVGTENGHTIMKGDLK